MHVLLTASRWNVKNVFCSVPYRKPYRKVGALLVKVAARGYQWICFQCWQGPLPQLRRKALREAPPRLIVASTGFGVG